ncbi:MAG TPA: MerR family transcriptional regulator [Solirubrobacteraceae bacterium]|nr:MerR family transcriptional regulator [Solirubrobacteraceae bacterium]
MRIGEVAGAVGTTPRTIRYYEEIGLMPGVAGREAGAHRTYSEDDVEQLREVLRLKELLGLSLDELAELVAGQEARRTLREEFRSARTSPARRRRILAELDAIVDRQLGLVDRRRAELDDLDAELRERRAKIAARLAELATPAST